MVEGEQYFKNTHFNIEKVTIKYNPDNPKENIYLFQIYTEMIAGVICRMDRYQGVLYLDL